MFFILGKSGHTGMKRFCGRIPLALANPGERELTGSPSTFPVEAEPIPHLPTPSPGRTLMGLSRRRACRIISG